MSWERFSRNIFDAPPQPRDIFADDFLRKVRDLYAVKRLYYPGSGDDDELEKVFPKDSLFLLDDSVTSLPDDKNSTHYVVGRIERSPFKPGVFDAIYVQDVHLNDFGLEGALETLCHGGIIIFSRYACQDGIGEKTRKDLKQLYDSPLLQNISLPFHHDAFQIFQKK